jgi:hypothetical protein
LTFVIGDTNDYPDGLQQDPLSLDHTPHDDPIVTDKSSHEYNAPSVCNKLIEKATYMSEGQKYNNIIIPMGGVFDYQSALVNFKGMEDMLNFIKENYSGLNIDFKMSTPTEYISSVKSEIDLSKLSSY